MLREYGSAISKKKVKGREKVESLKILYHLKRKEGVNVTECELRQRFFPFQIIHTKRSERG